MERCFCLLQRYHNLSGGSEGYQMAISNEAFQWFRTNLSVNMECFASPLNCWNERFFSVSYDTDQYFGSLGNFFQFRHETSESGISKPFSYLFEVGGSFEANPPFVDSVMTSMAKHIHYLLDSVKTSTVPFSFSIVVPAWTDCEGILIMNDSCYARPYVGYKLVLEKKEHYYRPGMQHRVLDREKQLSNVNTFVYVLQNDAGSVKWPFDLKMAKQLMETM